MADFKMDDLKKLFRDTYTEMRREEQENNVKEEDVISEACEFLVGKGFKIEKPGEKPEKPAEENRPPKSSNFSVWKLFGFEK